MKFLYFFLLIVNLSAYQKELWTGEYTHLIDREGYLLIEVQRPAPIDSLTDREILELEETVGKMYSVFQEVFGFGDFTRWMTLGEAPVASYLFPAGAVAESDEVNLDYRVRVMLLALSCKKAYIDPLTEEAISKIQAAAEAILSAPQEPNPLQEDIISWTHLRESFYLVKNELLAKGGHCPIEWKESAPIISYSPICRAFCNPEILQKQHVFETSASLVISNPLPYCSQHLMIVPKRHISSLLESSKEEILDKYTLFSAIDYLARTHFGCPKTAVLTRTGWRSGQTQSHFHDHVIGFDPDALHPWMRNYLSEITGNKAAYLDRAALAEIRNMWEIPLSHFSSGDK